MIPLNFIMWKALIFKLNCDNSGHEYSLANRLLQTCSYKCVLFKYMTLPNRYINLIISRGKYITSL